MKTAYEQGEQVNNLIPLERFSMIYDLGIGTSRRT